MHIVALETECSLGLCSRFQMKNSFTTEFVCVSMLVVLYYGVSKRSRRWRVTRSGALNHLGKVVKKPSAGLESVTRSWFQTQTALSSTARIHRILVQNVVDQKTTKPPITPQRDLQSFRVPVIHPWRTK
jgi:hypothetical protein